MENLYHTAVFMPLTHSLLKQELIAVLHVFWSAWMPRRFPSTSSLLLGYHVKQYIHTYTYYAIGVIYYCDLVVIGEHNSDKHILKIDSHSVQSCCLYLRDVTNKMASIKPAYYFVKAITCIAVCNVKMGKLRTKTLSYLLSLYNRYLFTFNNWTACWYSLSRSRWSGVARFTRDLCLAGATLDFFMVCFLFMWKLSDYKRMRFYIRNTENFLYHILFNNRYML